MAEQASSESAFPQGNTQSGGNSGGMSLRDWFAGQALAGFCAASDFVDPSPGTMARETYRYADALIAERRVVR